MNRIIPVFLLLLCLISACKSTDEPKPRLLLPYDDFLKQVAQERQTLRQQDPDKARAYLFTLINEDIPAYWTGTACDFNGTTRTPKEGFISCGYFVTNTLTDLGFPIDRVQLAQAPSSELVNAVCTEVKWISGYENMVKQLQSAPEKSVYLVGLDAHTGYLTRENKKSYFIHANWRGVHKEWVDTCMALKESKIFVLGSITANDEMLAKWISQ